ncbi:MAG: hypothetical protein JXR37_07680 [Kiritimatiellae bacterium]|nr:hypothetical protein [Kiritimatiellia bacterium]
MSKAKEIETPGWMLTFGDCMSLLVTFFVMLITFSAMEEAKLLELMGALRGAFGIMPTLQPTPFRMTSLNRSPEPIPLDEKKLAPISLSAPMMLKRFQEQSEAIQRQILVRMTDEGLSIVIHTAPVFGPGNAELRADHKDLFEGLGNLVYDIPNEVRIIGVVPEDVAIADTTAWRSGWGLAAARASVFADALCKACGFTRQRFGIGAALGPRLALAGGDLPAERIEILIVEKRQVHQVSPEEIVIFDKWD